jgi:hypothetical protein
VLDEFYARVSLVARTPLLAKVRSAVAPVPTEATQNYAWVHQLDRAHSDFLDTFVVRADGLEHLGAFAPPLANDLRRAALVNLGFTKLDSAVSRLISTHSGLPKGAFFADLLDLLLQEVEFLEPQSGDSLSFVSMHKTPPPESFSSIDARIESVVESVLRRLQPRENRSYQGR